MNLRIRFGLQLPGAGAAPHLYHFDGSPEAFLWAGRRAGQPECPIAKPVPPYWTCGSSWTLKGPGLTSAWSTPTSEIQHSFFSCRAAHGYGPVIRYAPKSSDFFSNPTCIHNASVNSQADLASVLLRFVQDDCAGAAQGQIYLQMVAGICRDSTGAVPAVKTGVYRCAIPQSSVGSTFQGPRKRRQKPNRSARPGSLRHAAKDCGTERQKDTILEW